MASPVRQISTESTPLSPVQAQVVEALASGSTVTAAATTAGIHRSTIYNWYESNDTFVTAVGQARADYTDALRDQLRDLSALALDTIRQILVDPKAPASVRLKAALAVLERPQFPERGWNLPERIQTPDREQIMDDLSLMKADYEHVRMEEKLRKRDPISTEFDTKPAAVEPSAPPAQPTATVTPATPRAHARAASSTSAAAERLLRR